MGQEIRETLYFKKIERNLGKENVCFPLFFFNKVYFFSKGFLDELVGLLTQPESKWRMTGWSPITATYNNNNKFMTKKKLSEVVA